MTTFSVAALEQEAAEAAATMAEAAPPPAHAAAPEDGASGEGAAPEFAALDARWDASAEEEGAAPAPEPAFEWQGGQATDGAPSTSPVDSLHLQYTAPSKINVYLPQVAHSIVDERVGSFQSHAMSAHERAQVIEMLADIEGMIDIDFEIVADPAQADFAFLIAEEPFAASGEDGHTLGYWEVGGGAIAIDGAELTLDGWSVMNPDAPRYSEESFQKGGIHYTVLLHELGHGLGMDHAHDDRWGGQALAGVENAFDTGDYGLNQNVYTVMSYNHGWEEHPLGSQAGPHYGAAATLMALDIAYLQSVYGANETANAGADTYVLDATDGPGTWYEAIWDTGGIDAIKAGEGAGPTHIDLRAATLDYSETGGGVVSFVDGVRGGVTIAAGVVIENAVGGDAEDYLRGNEAANELRGLDGNDTLLGEGGDDILHGGLYRDWVHGGAGDDEIYGSGGSDLLHGEQGADFIQGGGGHDQIWGGDGDDRLLGSGGDDWLDGGAGDDRISGGAGVSTFAFGAGWGDDIVTDYDDGIDTILFTAESGIAGAADLRITENEAGHTVIRDASDGANRIVIRDAGGSVDASDIVFEAAPAAWDEIA